MHIAHRTLHMHARWLEPSCALLSEELRLDVIQSFARTSSATYQLRMHFGCYLIGIDDCAQRQGIRNTISDGRIDKTA